MQFRVSEWSKSTKSYNKTVNILCCTIIQLSLGYSINQAEDMVYLQPSLYVVEVESM